VSGRPRKHLSRAERATVIEAYVAGESYRSIAFRTNIGTSTLGRLLRREGIPLRQPSKGLRARSLSMVEEEAICAAYLAGASLDALAEQWKRSRTGIVGVLNRHGIPRRDAYVASHSRKYPLREDAFSRLSDTSAYWLGFIAADGCVTRERVVQIALHACDEAHLHRFHDFLGCPERPLRRLPNLRVSQVSSARLAEDLRLWGIVERKSSVGVALHPDLVMQPGFWRGAIDGDGSIFRTRRVTVSLCGHPRLLDHYRTFLAATVLDGRRQAMQIRRDGLGSVTVTGRSAIRLLRLLYRDSNVALERKRVTAEQILAGSGGAALFAPLERVAARQRRLIWQGTTEPRQHHVAELRAVARSVLETSGFARVSSWKPTARSSMVAFRALRRDRDVLVWVTARWKAVIPPAVLAARRGTTLFALHVSPRDPSVHFLSEVRNRSSSTVPASLLARVGFESELLAEVDSIRCDPRSNSVDKGKNREVFERGKAAQPADAPA
jgi:hypothetical protein